MKYKFRSKIDSIIRPVESVLKYLPYDILKNTPYINLIVYNGGYYKGKSSRWATSRLNLPYSTYCKITDQCVELHG